MTTTTTTLRKVVAAQDAVDELELAVMGTPDDPEVAGHSLVTIPDISIFHAYEGRKFGAKTEMEIFDYARAKHHNVLISGPTGDGKTMASMAYAAKNNLNFYSVPCNIGVDPAQLFGKWIIGDDGHPVWVDGGLTHLVRNGGLLLINEGNAMPAKVAMVLFSLLDHRREITLLDHKGEVIKAHPDLLIIMDMNPGYAGTSQLNAAFRNRFPIQLSWDYDPDVESRLIKSACLREDIVNGLRTRYRDGQMFTPTSTNMMIEFERFVRDLGLEFAVENWLNHYETEERAAVKMVFDTFIDNLKAEYAAMLDKGPDNPMGDIIVFADTNWIYSNTPTTAGA